jgi:DNA-directed RNA polymerase subunit H
MSNSLPWAMRLKVNKLVATIHTHSTVPLHEILDEKAATAVLMHYGVDRSKLPKIKKDDPALPEGGKIGDIISITRNSATAGVAPYYRVVVE